MMLNPFCYDFQNTPSAYAIFIYLKQPTNDFTLIFLMALGAGSGGLFVL